MKLWGELLDLILGLQEFAVGDQVKLLVEVLESPVKDFLWDGQDVMDCIEVINVSVALNIFLSTCLEPLA